MAFDTEVRVDVLQVLGGVLSSYNGVVAHPTPVVRLGQKPCPVRSNALCALSAGAIFAQKRAKRRQFMPQNPALLKRRCVEWSFITGGSAPIDGILRKPLAKEVFR